MDYDKNKLPIGEKGNNLILTVRLVPNSKKSCISEINSEYIRIKIKAPAVENRANTELIVFMSKLLNIPKTRVNLKQGLKSKLKFLEIVDFSLEGLLSIFDSL